MAHVYKDVYPPVAGGIEKHIDGIRRAMPQVTSDILVCARAARTSEARVGTGVEVRVGELGRVLSTPIAPGFPFRLRRLRADVYHVHMPNPLGELSALVALRDRPFVVSYHADVVRQARLMPVYGPLLRKCLDCARAVIVGSEGIASSSPVLAPVRGRVQLVPYAVDTEVFRPENASADEVAAIRSRHGTPLVVSVGRLVHYKGLDQLIAASASIPATIVIAGSGPLEADLRNRARGRSNVHFLGHVPEERLPALLSAADCFVLPSVNRAESFGIVTLEAQAMGTPAVVTDVGTGTTEAIEPGKSGLVVAPGSPDELAAAIRSLLDDPARARGMGAIGAARVRERHTREIQARRLARIYERAVEA